MLHHVIQGTGIPVLFLHGFCEDARIWNRIIPGLESDYRLIVPDLPGFGSSEVLSSGLDGWAGEVLRLLSFLGIEDAVHVVGHSMGGYVALALAEKFPGRVRSLTLLHSSAYADSPERREKREKSIKFIQKNGSSAYVKAMQEKRESLPWKLLRNSLRKE
jgi:pimeloyl-ACP methyl ester carboxylesterase